MNIPSRPEPESKSRLRLWLRLLKLTGQIERELRQRLRDEYNTTLPRFDVMAALHRYPDGLKMSELSSTLRVSNGNVTGIVERLAEEGLVDRVAVAGDRRAQLARLSAAGRESFETMAAAHEAWIDALLGGLSAEDAEAVVRLLDNGGAS